MPRRSHSFELDADPADVREAAVAAVRELGWYWHEGDQARLEVREDPTGLCCTMSPVEATLAFGRAPSGTSVQIEVYVPGFGPIPKRQLADRLAGLQQRITRWTRQRAKASA